MSKTKCKNCRKVARLERKLEEAYILLFVAIRTTAVLPIGAKLGKTDKEISDKTFETIAEMKNTVDYCKTRRLMELADCWGGDHEEDEEVSESNS